MLRNENYIYKSALITLVIIAELLIFIREQNMFYWFISIEENLTAFTRFFFKRFRDLQF